MSTQTNAAVRNEQKQRIGIRTMVQVGMLSAIATVLMLFEIPLPFAPSFYEIDFSEVPVLIGCFTMGPLAGAANEMVKILLNFLINGTVTAGVGEIANFPQRISLKRRGQEMSTQTNAAVRNEQKQRIGIRTMVQVGMLSAIATVLMLFEIPLPFAPSFYEIDFSEVPVLIGCFTMGPLAGAANEMVKILLNFLINGTVTAGVGEIANFLIGCALCVPAGLIYKRQGTRKGALIGMAVGTGMMVIVGCVINAYVLLPVYAKAFQMPLDALIGMGTAVNPNITGLSTFVIFAVAPFNLLKGVLVSVIVLVIYKKISPIFRMR